jgi:hypothetical protein
MGEALRTAKRKGKKTTQTPVLITALEVIVCLPPDS